MDRAVYQVIKDYRKILERAGIRANRIILYGSHALGLSREDSDIDLVVISDDFGKMDLWERLTLLGEATATLGRPIEALGYTEKEFISGEEGSFIVDEVKTKGIEVK